MSSVFSPLLNGERDSTSNVAQVSFHEISGNNEEDDMLPEYEPRVSTDHHADDLFNKRELSVDGTQVTPARMNEAGTFGSYVNLTNSIIGSGVLGLPYAFAASGWTLGYVLILLSAICTVFSLHLLGMFIYFLYNRTVRFLIYLLMTHYIYIIINL